MKLTKATQLNTERDQERLILSFDNDLQKLFTAMQGRIRFGTGADGARGENIEGEFQVVSDTGSANTEFAVTHTIGAVPIGYIVIKNSKAGTVYDGTTSWTSTTLYLRHEAANAAITVFLLK